jgi:hypothetical protein
VAPRLKIIIKYTLNLYESIVKCTIKENARRKKITSVCKVGVSYAVNLVGSVIPRGKKKPHSSTAAIKLVSFCTVVLSS